MQSTARLARLAVVVGLVLACLSPGTAQAKRYTFTAAHPQGDVLTFKLRGLQTATVRRAHVRASRYTKRISRRVLRRAARRGKLRIRVPRRVARRLAARGGARKHRARLIVYASPRPGTSPAVGPEAPTVARPPAGPASQLLAPLGAILSDAVASLRVRRSTFEPRPENGPANHRAPRSSELAAWRSVTNYAGVERGSYYVSRVTGNFTGTTDEILQWGAHKWGFDEDLLRAQAVQESTWRQSAVGDAGVSYGILQLKSTVQKGTLPLSRDSTAFNVDYALMTLRHCYDGYATWLGNGYQAGDFWGCLGYYYSGNWYDADAKTYIEHLRQNLAAREWQKAGF